MKNYEIRIEDTSTGEIILSETSPAVLTFVFKDKETLIASSFAKCTHDELNSFYLACASYAEEEARRMRREKRIKAIKRFLGLEE